MEAVHARFAGSNPDLANGFAEHAPMGAEAMLAMGVDPGSVLRWSERHEPEPADRGSPVRVAYENVRAELDGEEWRYLAALHIDRNVGGLDARLFHGLIRTAHAVRALEHHDNQAGRAELATGLAAWSIWGVDRSTDEPHEVGGDPMEVVLDAALRGAAAFVQKPSIVTIHAVTAPMAFLLVADLVDAAAHRRAAAVFTRTHRNYPAPPTDLASIPRPGTEELAGVLAQWDAHPAKLVEAALRGHDRTGQVTFLHAARAMLGR